MSKPCPVCGQALEGPVVEVITGEQETPKAHLKCAIYEAIESESCYDPRGIVQKIFDKVISKLQGY